ncbi:MAG: Ig-like domain-containing protein [Rikenellaceae bacterium]
MKIYVSYILILLFFTSGLFFRCANPASPTGGLKDTLPPKIVSISPSNFTTNFNATKVVITFDEYSVLKDAQKEIVIAPPMTKRPTFKIKGRSLEITMESELDSATTYKIDFGKAIQDNNEGNALMNFSYIFSTGEHIDSLVMTGQLVSAETGDTIINGLVYLYDSNNDSLEVDSTLYIGRPLSVARTDSNGVFIATNLKNMDYLVYGIEDKNNNSYYDVGDDKVAFSSKVHNPTDMPPFKMWYNDRRKTIEATPQFQFRSFTERQKRRQSLQDMERTQRGILNFYFAADSAKVESVELEGIDESLLFSEFKPTGDTLTVWIMQPDSVLPDTLKGAINYHILSTLGEDSIASRKINLFSFSAKSREAARQSRQNNRSGGEKGGNGERPEKGGERQSNGERPEGEGRPEDGEMPNVTEGNMPPIMGGNTIKFSLKAFKADNKNVVDDVEFNLNIPIKEFNKELATLEMAIPEEEVKGDRRQMEEKAPTKVEDLKREKVNFTFEQDSITALIWRLKADWQPNTTYFLDLKDSTFVNIKGEVSDSLVQKITVMNPEEASVIILDVINADTTINYVVELLSGTKNTSVSYRNKYTNNGSHTLDYVAPGTYKIKVIKDVNKNGKWDTGELLTKIAPEEVAIFSDDNKMNVFETKANWEQTITIDISKLFK